MASEAEVETLLSTFPNVSFIRNFVEVYHHVTDTPSIFMLHAGIHALLAVYPHNLTLPLGVPIRANTFTWLVGESGGPRKTTAIKYAIHVIKESKNASYLLVDPASPEAMVKELGKIRHRLIPITEGGDFLERSSGGKYLSAMRDNFVRLYDGDDVGHSVLSERRSIAPVDRHSVSVFAASTPVHLETSLTRRDMEGGFFNRFMVVHGYSERHNAEMKTNRAGEDWLAARLASYSGNRLDHPPSECAGLTPGAAQAWRGWTQRVQHLVKRQPQHVRPLIVRVQTHAAKMMQVFAFDHELITEGDWYITEDVVNAATQVCDWALVDAMGVYEHLAQGRYEHERRNVLRAFEHWQNQDPAEATPQYAQIAHALSPKMGRKALLETLDSLCAENVLFRGKRNGVDVWARSRAALETLGGGDL